MPIHIYTHLCVPSSRIGRGRLEVGGDRHLGMINHIPTMF